MPSPLSRSLVCLALATGLGACGDKDDTGGSLDASSPCGQYISAFRSCVEEFGGSADDFGITDAYCESYPEGSALDSAFTCYADTLNAADCSTAEGYSAAQEEMSANCNG